MNMFRVMVAIDVSNLYYTLKRKYNGKKLNYQALLEECKTYGQIHTANAYASEMLGKANPFFDCLKQFGYSVKVRRVQTFHGENGDRLKADWDVGIAVDLIRFLNKVDVVVLGTADGDMIPVVQYLKEHGIRVVVYGCNISMDLREVADKAIEIAPHLLEAE